MDLSIDKSKLKIKHFLFIHKECEDYPTTQDYLFELINELEINEMLYEPFGVVFCRRKLYSTMGEKDNTHQNHLEMLKEFEKEGYLEKVEKGGIRTIKFKLKTHPWIKIKDK